LGGQVNHLGKIEAYRERPDLPVDLLDSVSSLDSVGYLRGFGPQLAETPAELELAVRKVDAEHGNGVGVLVGSVRSTPLE
jgi:hypothetical protein